MEDSQLKKTHNGIKQHKCIETKAAAIDNTASGYWLLIIQHRLKHTNKWLMARHKN